LVLCIVTIAGCAGNVSGEGEDTTGEGEAGAGEGEGEGAAVVPHTFAPPAGIVGAACASPPPACPAFTSEPQTAVPVFLAVDGETALLATPSVGVFAFDAFTFSPTGAVRGHENGIFIRGDMGIALANQPAIDADGSLASVTADGFVVAGGTATVEVLDLSDPAHPRQVSSVALPGIVSDAGEQVPTSSAFLTGDELDVVDSFEAQADGTLAHRVTRFRVAPTAPGCLVKEGSGLATGTEEQLLVESSTQLGFVDTSDATQPKLARFRLSDLSTLPEVALTPPPQNAVNQMMLVATTADIWSFTPPFGPVETFNEDGSTAASFTLEAEQILAHGADLVVVAVNAQALDTDVVVVSNHVATTTHVPGTPRGGFGFFGFGAGVIVGDTLLMFSDPQPSGAEQLVAFDLITQQETGRQPTVEGVFVLDASGNAYIFSETTTLTPIVDPTTATLGASIQFPDGGFPLIANAGGSTTLAASIVAPDIASSAGPEASFALSNVDAALLGDNVVFATKTPPEYDEAPLASVTDLERTGITATTVATSVSPQSAPATLGSDFFFIDAGVLRSTRPGTNVAVSESTVAVLGAKLALLSPTSLRLVDASDPAHPVVGPELATSAVGAAFAAGSDIVFDDGHTLVFVDASGTRSEHGTITGTLVDATDGPVAWTFDGFVVHGTNNSSFALPATATTPVAVADGLAFTSGNTLGLVRLDNAAHDGGTLSFPAAPTVVGSAPGFIAIEIGDSVIAVVTVATDGIDVATVAAGPLSVVRALFADNAAWFVGAGEGVTKLPLSCASP
jgi:hypothetical protein